HRAGRPPGSAPARHRLRADRTGSAGRAGVDDLADLPGRRGPAGGHLGGRPGGDGPGRRGRAALQDRGHRRRRRRPGRGAARPRPRLGLRPGAFGAHAAVPGDDRRPDAAGAAHPAAALRAWLHRGIPVSLDGPAVASLLAVVAAALVASTVAALGVIREPLSASLTASVRPRPASRVSLVLRSAVVAVALAAVGNLVTSGDQSSQLLALLTPMLVALAVAVG